MRDLYHRLGMRYSAPPSALERAIQKCADRQLRDDAQVVLLNPQFRTSYDLAHATLRQLAVLRASLGLQHTPNWNPPASSDFTAMPQRSQVEALQNKIRKNPDPQPSLLSALLTFPFALLRAFPTLSVIGGIVLVGWLYSACDSRPKSTTPQYTYSAPRNYTPTYDTTRPAFTEPVQPLPLSGTVHLWHSAEAVAPFAINPHSDANYLVKLVDAYSRTEVMRVFVRGGSPIEVKVPLGTYEIRYASGDQWYGYQHLFGPDTAYAKADKTFDFRIIGNQVSGYTLTLYKVRNGNLHTSPINAREF